MKLKVTSKALKMDPPIASNSEITEEISTDRSDNLPEDISSDVMENQRCQLAEALRFQRRGFVDA